MGNKKLVRPVPCLQEYGINPKTGFLPAKQPLSRLRSDFELWELLIDDLQHLLIARVLRAKISSLPELDTGKLNGLPEYQRAFLVLSLLSHAYVWGAKGEPVLQVLPRQLSKPWLNVSKFLGLRPISCHAALVYYNWKLLDDSEPVSLSNLATLHTISGGIDESWFYLITVAIEAAGGARLETMLSVLNSIEQYTSLTDDDADKQLLLLESMAVELKHVAEGIAEMTKILVKMSNYCDPYIFYHRVRIYFSGWTNFDGYATDPSVARETGLLYEGDDEDEIGQLFRDEGYTTYMDGKRKLYPGGSAAQSCLIHALDVFLGVEHQITGQGRGCSASPSMQEACPMSNGKNSNGKEKQVNFLEEMRFNMPAPFRKFLVHLKESVSLRDFVGRFSRNPVDTDLILVRQGQLVDAYHACVDNLVHFRNKHIQIVTRYIVQQSAMARKSGLEIGGFYGLEIEGSHGPLSPKAGGDDIGQRGTGGTEVMPFLKQARDETQCLRK